MKEQQPFNREGRKELGKLEMTKYGGKPRYGAIALIFIGAGAGIKKRNSKQEMKK